MEPTTFAEVFAAYLELVQKPEVTPEECESFWSSLEAVLPLEAVADMRQSAEWYLNGEPEPPAEFEDPYPELLRLWAHHVSDSSE